MAGLPVPVLVLGFGGISFFFFSFLTKFAFGSVFLRKKLNNNMYKPLTKRNCIRCNKEFESKRDDARHCSKICNIKTYSIENKELLIQKRKEKYFEKSSNPEYKKDRADYAKNWREKNREKCRADVRERLNTGIESNKDNIIFYGYKEPLTKFEGGFGYKGVLMYHKDKGKVQCHLCGLLFKQLNNGHLGKVHGITASQYKEKTGLSYSTALCGEETREKYINRGWNPNHMEELKKAQEKRKLYIKEKGKDPQLHPRMALEKYNERGTCPDQLLDIIDKTVKSYGRVMTQEEFLSFHAGKYLGSIRRTFGTWTNALYKLDLKTNKPEPYTREKLCAYLQDFYKINKRTARWSDFNRGLLPHWRLYYSHFKNLNHARLLANVPLVIDLGRRKKEDWLPSEEERYNMLSKQYSK